jgi:hypothetical protein
MLISYISILNMSTESNAALWCVCIVWACGAWLQSARELSGIARVDRPKFLGGFYLLLLHIFLAAYGFQI